MHSDVDKAKADTADLASRLRVKAAMLRLGERIAFGSDADALEDAADAIAELTRERDEARAAALEEAAKAMDDWPCRAAAIRALKEPTHD